MNLPSLKPAILEGPNLRLEPFEARRAPDLFEASQYPEIWTYMSYGKMPDLAEFDEILAVSEQNRAAGREVMFTIIQKPNGKIIGSSRIFEYAPQHRTAEIGWTWMPPHYWRTGVNSETKYLLLTHCFETLDLVRVQLKADARNIRSQEAILRLGAVREGLLRRHMIQRHTGFIRDTVIFSITDLDWPDIKKRLEERLKQP